MSNRILLLLCLILAGFQSPGFGQVTNFVWATKQGSVTNTIACDQRGSSYSAGAFNSQSNFGSITLSPHGQSDAFIAKYSLNSVPVWVTQLGATYRASPTALVLGKHGDLFVTGTIADSMQQGITPPLISRIFIAKLDTFGNVRWIVTSTNAPAVSANSIAVSPSGHWIYVEGSSNGATFLGTDSLKIMLKSGLFTMRLSDAGAIRWARSDSAQGHCLCLDSSENVYLGGGYVSSATVGGIKITPVKSTQYDGFLASYDSAGTIRWAHGIDSIVPNSLLYSAGYLFTSMSGNTPAARMSMTGSNIHYLRNSSAGVTQIASDEHGGIYLCGDGVPKLDTITAHGGAFFIARLDTGLHTQWVTSITDSGGQQIGGPEIAVDTVNGIFVAGGLRSPTMFGSLRLAPGGRGYLALLSQSDLSFSISPQAMLCPGDSLIVQVQTFGSFYPINTFTVQLSDSLGRFGTPDMLGTFTQNESCTLACAIPSNVHSGTKYRVRIISSSPNIVTHDNGFNLTMHSAPPATLVPSGAIDVCEGDSIKLTAAGGVQYVWSTGETSPSIWVNATGNYSVSVVGSNGCIAKPAAATVTIRLLPPVPAITLTGNTLYSSSTTNNQWNRNGAPIPGATGASFVVRSGGTYSVTVSNAYHCSSTSDEYVLSVLDVEQNAPPTLAIDGNGNLQTGLEAGSTVRVTISNLLGANIVAVERTMTDATLPLASIFQSLPNGAYFIRVEAVAPDLTNGRIASLRYLNFH